MSPYHKILGIQKGASKGQIKNAYRKLAKEYHPDRSDLPNAKEKFIEIAQAYEVLYDGKLEKNKAHQKNNFNTQSAKEKYWHIYSPPRNEHARTAWETVDRERRQYYKKRAKKQADKKFDKFKEESALFKKSSFYYPLLVLYFLIQTSFVFGAIGILFLPFIGHYIDPNKYDYEPFDLGKMFFVVLLFGPVSYFLIKGLIYIKKIIDPYFKDF